MPNFTQHSPAFGAPGCEPKWTQGDKDAVVTAYSTASRIWFTLWNGVMTEAYYPTIDRPQIRDFQFLISDGESFFHEEKRHLKTQIKRLAPDAPAFGIINSDHENRYEIHKEFISDPHLSCILQRVRLICQPDWENKLNVYVLAAPHLDVSGFGNTARVVEVAGRRLLAAERCGTWLAILADVPFVKLSAGYVAESDGWTDLYQHFHMDWEFDYAPDGNVALTGQIDLSQTRRTILEDGRVCREWVIALGFGDNFHGAATTVFQSLDLDFAGQQERFIKQWERTCHKTLPLHEQAGDDGCLYRSSIDVLLSHEDKTFPGAFIASLSIPWGEVRNAVEVDGYHLVWPRDMVNSASALLAAGDDETPLRALVYLAASQQPDGGFPQNFWVNAEPHWKGIQLDEVSFPILLAYYLKREDALRTFDPYEMVMRGATYLIKHGPATQQERWEENGGYSPSTLAANIAALVIAADFARGRDDAKSADFILAYADWLESKLEIWMTTTQSCWSNERIYARINPIDLHDPHANENLDEAMLTVSNLAPDAPNQFPARDIVDGGCLHLVRFGLRAPDDAIISATIPALDKALKVETARGTCWLRYNNDGYGQRDDGSAFKDWGVGRAWPLLGGERAHFELSRGGDYQSLRASMETLSSEMNLLPEQAWDAEDLPAEHLQNGGATGSAQPLVWAHAEYVKLLRSIRDGQTFDRIREVEQRYLERKDDLFKGEVWKMNRQPQTMRPASICRVILDRAFSLHWTNDNWHSAHDTKSQDSGINLHWCDIATPENGALQWTFFYPESESWEGRDYHVEVEES